MICPHCAKSLLRRERTGRRCPACRREFALEPKESPARMHDLRMRRLTEKLSDEGNLRYTPTQLWYAATRRDVPSVDRGYHAALGWMCGIIVVGGFICVVSGFVPVRPGIGAGLLLLIVIPLLLIFAKPWFRQRTTVRIPVTRREFRTGVFDRWAQIYGGPPAGMVAEDIPLPTVPTPRLALLCADRSVLACLAANNAAELWEMALADRVDRLPPEVPVLVLHDAGLPGVGFGARARNALGARVVLLGLSAKSALAARSAVRLRERPDPAAPPVPEWAAGSAAERDWLAAGWWSPVGALSPAALLGVVARGVERVQEAGDPDRQRAREIGFLTWPSS
ncbi:hypothetical protein AB0H42_26505 [Nocardia sp. NPDC050799]|uniref:hypothetical protein n=1 Tax=Nocardia sp. NPDC050799 TaxID=3154842 RepID=UPI0033F9F95B